VHKVAVASSVAGALLVLAASGLPEVCDGRELGNDGAAVVEAALEGLQRLGCRLLLAEFDVHVAHHMVRQIVAHVHILQLAELRQFLKHVLVEILGISGKSFSGSSRRFGKQ